MNIQRTLMLWPFHKIEFGRITLNPWFLEYRVSGNKNSVEIEFRNETDSPVIINRLDISGNERVIYEEVPGYPGRHWPKKAPDLKMFAHILRANR